jgi:predicted GNAT family acetyltransferase
VDPLENAVWHTLVGDLSHLAELDPADPPRAARFDPEVSLFSAIEDEPTEESWASLARLVGPGGVAVLFRAEVAEPPGWTTVARMDGLQMSGEAVRTDGEPDGLVRLTTADVPDMLELIARTEPGPFAARTIEAGLYLGVRRDDRLVAMTGQRLRCDGWVEISAVCTDPDHRGQGLARQLVAAVVSAVREEGAQPFLHVAATNDPARALYGSMGFEEVRPISAVVLQPPDP